MYYNNNDFYSYLQQLYQYVAAQQQRIEQLEAIIDDLQSDVDTLKQSNNSRVGKIEYKFDQLKIETLEGTLNIGITPNGGVESNSIDDFSVSQNKVNTPSSFEQNPEVYENIQKQIYEYLNGDCYNAMKSIEQQYNYPLDPPYRDFIIDDVRKQIDNRIQYYLNGADLRDKSEDSLVEIEQTTVNKVRHDIEKTIEEYIKHLPKKGV